MRLSETWLDLEGGPKYLTQTVIPFYSQACADLVEAKGWRSAVILHEDSAVGAATIAPDSDRLALLPRQLPLPNEDALLR